MKLHNYSSSDSKIGVAPTINEEWINDGCIDECWENRYMKQEYYYSYLKCLQVQFPRDELTIELDLTPFNWKVNYYIAVHDDEQNLNSDDEDEVQLVQSDAITPGRMYWFVIGVMIYQWENYETVEATILRCKIIEF